MDSPMAEATSGVKRGSLSPLPSSTTKRAKLGVAQDELTSLNVELNDTATLEMWPRRLQEASKDPRKMTMLLSTVLVYVVDALAETSVKVNFILPLTLTKAKKFVENFNPNERREWEDGIRTCMECNDWSDLITHRTYTVTLQNVFLTMATVSLQKPTVTPIDRASSETMYVSKRFCRW